MHAVAFCGSAPRNFLLHLGLHHTDASAQLRGQKGGNRRHARKAVLAFSTSINFGVRANQQVDFVQHAPGVSIGDKVGVHAYC
jgi:hypothetical protein